jgi:hypothetical protein
MDAAHAFLWSLPTIVFGVGTVITLVAVRRAPEGCEDEEGFHYSRPPGKSLEARQAPSSDTVPPMGTRFA